MPSEKVRGGLYWGKGTGTWHYEFRFLGEKHNGDTGISTQRGAAVAWLRKFKEDLSNARVGLARPRIPTVRELAEAWIEAHHGILSDSMVANVGLRLRLHWESIADLPAEQVHDGFVMDLRTAYLRAEAPTGSNGMKLRRSEGGANKIVHTLRQVYGWGVATRRISLIPFGVRPLKVKETVKSVIWPEEIRVFAKASKRYKNTDARIAMLACMCLGLRESEALGMRWEWFDWTGDRYQVGKAKDGQVRAVPLHHVFRRVVRQRWIAQGRPQEGLVLPNVDGVAHVGGYLRKPVAMVAKVLGKAGLSPHALRRTFATGVWEHGATGAQLMAWLGHEDIATSMGYVVQRAQQGEAVQRRFAASAGWPVPVESPAVSADTKKPSNDAA
ncbi:MAG TPA: site-specific integrase [Holophagaceae bacterium]|nr:site-specific integrase [Holophagaceae bacterium]